MRAEEDVQEGQQQGGEEGEARQTRQRRQPRCQQTGLTPGYFPFELVHVLLFLLPECSG